MRNDVDEGYRRIYEQTKNAAESVIKKYVYFNYPQHPKGFVDNKIQSFLTKDFLPNELVVRLMDQLFSDPSQKSRMLKYFVTRHLKINNVDIGLFYKNYPFEED